MTLRDLFYFAAGLGFLCLAKVKHALRGYTTPKPFAFDQMERCVTYDIGVVETCLRHLERYLGSDAGMALAGRNVLELGPGSDLGVGLLLLARGAGTYNACDVNPLAAGAPDAFYEALFARLGSAGTGGGADSGQTREAAAGAGADLEALRGELAKARAGTPSRLNYVVRDDFDLARAFGEESMDLVFSNAAFEHFDDVDSTVAGLTRVCRPGAVMVAVVDLQTHSRWIRDKDPNNIYRYGSALYAPFRFRGSPNRLRPRDYRRILERHGWTEVSVQPLVRVEAPNRSGLNRSFRDPGNEMDLLVIALCARKRGAGGP